jgi:aminoglycoside phosphotransferase (APT) family kinase protein
MARHRAELIDFVLTRQIAEMTAPEDWSADYKRGVEKSFAASGISGDRNSEQALSQSLKKLLADVVAQRKDMPASRPAREALARGLAKAESDYRNKFEALVQAEGRSAPTAKSHIPESKMTPEAITAYLRKHFPEHRDIRASKVVPIPGGRSKGTTLVVLEGYPTFPREIVLRQDLTAEVGGQSVTYEYPLQEVLWRDGLTVPHPLWLETQRTALGGPFSAFAKSPGSPGGTLFRMDAPAAAARDAAKFFGKLHSVDIDATGLRSKLLWGNSQTPVRDMLDFFYAKWRDSEVEPSPLIETSFLWLYDHLDVIDPKAALVHGDSSYHNMLIHDGRLSVVLDWEFAHAGDPAEDLLGSEHFTTQVLPWAEFMKIYRENGGGEISRARFQFFALWRSLRFAIATAAAGHVFTSGANRDLRVAAIGYNSFPRLLQDVARQLAAMD